MIIGALGAALAAACGGDADRAAAPADAGAVARGAATAAPAGTAADRRTVLVLGTSLTAGLGLPSDQAWPALLQQRVDSLELPWHIVNGGLSGETSAGAVRRMDWLLRGPIAVLIIETGANDGLRGLDVDSTRANLLAIIARARAHDSSMTIVLTGMEAPPNLGARFTRNFRAVYADVARREQLALVPFILAGVAGVDSLNQADGIHPVPDGQRIVLDNVWSVVGPILRHPGAVGAP